MVGENARGMIGVADAMQVKRNEEAIERVFILLEASSGSLRRLQPQGRLQLVYDDNTRLSKGAYNHGMEENLYQPLADHSRVDNTDALFCDETFCVTMLAHSNKSRRDFRRMTHHWTPLQIGSVSPIEESDAE